MDRTSNEYHTYSTEKAVSHQICIMTEQTRLNLAFINDYFIGMMTNTGLPKHSNVEKDVWVGTLKREKLV